MIRLAWRMLGGRPLLALLAVLCIAIGVAARGAVVGAVGGVERHLAAEARQLLAADLEVSSARPFTAEERARIAAALPHGARMVEVRQLTAMVTGPGGTALGEVLAVGPNWPLVGTFASQPAAAAAEIAAGAAVAVVDPELLARLGAQAGDTVRVGAAPCRIAGTSTQMPGAAFAVFALGPRLVVPLAVLDSAGLAGEGVRSRHRLAIALPDPREAAAVAAAVRRRLGLPDADAGGPWMAPTQAALTVRTADDAARQAARAAARAADILRLVALVALVLGAVGVGAVAAGVLRQQVDDVAVLQVLGASRQRVAGLVLAQVGMLGLAGGLLGATGGGLLAALALHALGQPGTPRPGDALGGVLLAVLASWAAVALPLLALLRQEPLAVLRGEPPPALPRGRALAASAAIAAAALLAAVHESRSWVLGPALVAGIAAAALLAAGAVALLLGPLARWRAPWLCARLAVAGAAHPGRGSLALASALAIAAAASVALALVHAGFARELGAPSLSAKPTWFALDIHEDQRSELAQLLGEAGCRVNLRPWVRARLAAIDGAAARARGGGREAERAEHFLRREQNLTWAAAPGTGERLVEGRWAGPGEAVVERRWAETVGVGIGSRLRFVVLGVPVEVVVSGLKQVDWWSFQPNFFITLHPDDLAAAPAVWLGSIAVPEGTDRAALLKRVAEAYPNVSLIDIAAAAEAGRRAVDRAGLAIAAVVGIAIIAALAVVLGSVLAHARERAAELATLAALGAGRRLLARTVAAEFALLAGLGTLLGTAAGLAGGAWACRSLLALPLAVPWSALAAIAGALAAAALGTALLAARQAWRAPPLAVLRQAE